jgi:membrane protein YdbS with pleckstrin-like domain
MNIQDQQRIQKEGEEIFNVKQAFSSFIVSVVFIQVIIFLVIIAIIALINLLNPLLPFTLNWITTFAIIGLVLFDAIVVFRGFLNWKFTSYRIKAEELLVKNGILRKKEKLYILNQIETITIRQSILGRVFNYGSLNIFSPLLQAKIPVINIPNPREYEKLLLTRIPERQKDKTTIIPDTTNKLIGD